MKPTSYIFIAMSIVLFFGGFITCKVAESMADDRDIKLYDQEFDDDGDAVYSFDLGDEEITKLELKFNDVNIRLHHSDERSYVVLKNFDVNSYRTRRSGNSVTIDGTVQSISSFIDLSDGGIKFKGLRYLFVQKPKSGHERMVDLYLADDTAISGVTITANGGTLESKDLSGNIDFFVNATACDVNFDHTDTTTVIDIHAEDATVNMTDTLASTISISTVKSNVNIHTPSEMNDSNTGYDLQTENGLIYVGGADVGSPYRVSSAINTYTVKVKTDIGAIRLN